MKTFYFWIIVYGLIVLVIIGGESSLNLFENDQGSKQKIYAAKKAELDSLVNCAEAKRLLKEADIKNAPLIKTANSFAIQNEKAVSERRSTDAELYKAKISALNKEIADNSKVYSDWLDEKSKPINSYYDDKSKSQKGIYGFLNSLSIVIVFPWLAFLIPIFSSAITETNFPGYSMILRAILMLVAIGVQYASCQITREALVLKLGHEDLADLGAYALTFGIPSLHFAAIEWLKSILLKAKAKIATLQTMPAKTDPEILMYTIPNDKDGAVAWLYEQKKDGNGRGDQSLVAKKFNVSNEAVRKWLCKYATNQPS